ncbi:MAG: hypothetical protein OSA98_20680 [Rubripirellula sp.]|nr:hypothetical protein [Rubripirellula sp.]
MHSIAVLRYLANPPMIVLPKLVEFRVNSDEDFVSNEPIEIGSPRITRRSYETRGSFLEHLVLVAFGRWLSHGLQTRYGFEWHSCYNIK